MSILKGNVCILKGCDFDLAVDFDGLYYLSRKFTQYPVTDPDFSGLRLMLAVYNEYDSGCIAFLIR